jgi:signal transduction histidine kinase
VLKAARHLLELIDEVLELARIESGRMTISPEPVALADTVREVLALVAPLPAIAASSLPATPTGSRTTDMCTRTATASSRS